MNLVIDIGNSFIKLAIFNGREIIHSSIVQELTEGLLESIYTEHKIQSGIYSSVRTHANDSSLLKKYNFIHLTHLTPLPLVVNYKTPETLGIDRLAAVVGSSIELKEKEVLTIDIGTCITFDFLNAKNDYLGGAIAPGFQMRFKALNDYTEKLPLIEFEKEQLKLIGDTTESAIVSGVYNGMKNEIEGTINAYILQYPQIKIVVTGGDRNLFDLEPKNRIFADEFLVLKGLNEILIYNEK